MLLYHASFVSVGVDISVRRALVVNLFLLGVVGWFAWLEAGYPALYYRAVQEDQALEWTSFWAFFLAGVVFAVAAWRQQRSTAALPWFLTGLALFCVFVAMEEISWGQRIIGHRPPEYFLERNFQQELNLHNIASTKARLLAFRGVILGYGVLLPLLALIPFVGRLLDRLAIVPPPAELVPSMLVMLWVHVWYPWKFTGEVIECILGFGFLFASLANAARYSDGQRRRSATTAASSMALVAVLGFASAWWSQNRQSDDPANLELARAETEALKTDVIDLAGGWDRPTITTCGLHKRLYTFVQEDRHARPLRDGSFAALVDRGLPEIRAQFFLDPWNSPYWIRDRCDANRERRVVFVYSFGPNRSRDSSRWEILGDDIGQYVLIEP